MGEYIQLLFICCGSKRGLVMCSSCPDMSPLSDIYTGVSGGSEAPGGKGGLLHTLHVLAAPRSLQHLPFPDALTCGPRPGLHSVKMGIRTQDHRRMPGLSDLCLITKCLSPEQISLISHLWPPGRDPRPSSFLPLLHRLWASSDCTRSLWCGWYLTREQGTCQEGTSDPILSCICAYSSFIIM